MIPRDTIGMCDGDVWRDKGGRKRGCQYRHDAVVSEAIVTTLDRDLFEQSSVGGLCGCDSMFGRRHGNVEGVAAFAMCVFAAYCAPQQTDEYSIV